MHGGSLTIYMQVVTVLHHRQRPWKVYEYIISFRNVCGKSIFHCRYRPLAYSNLPSSEQWTHGKVDTPFIWRCLHPNLFSRRYDHLMFSRVYTETLQVLHENVSKCSATNKIVIDRGNVQESHEVLAQILCRNTINTCHSHSNFRSVIFVQ